jgi:hypothetical protein
VNDEERRRNRTHRRGSWLIFFGLVPDLLRDLIAVARGGLELLACLWVRRQIRPVAKFLGEIAVMCRLEGFCARVPASDAGSTDNAGSGDYIADDIIGHPPNVQY